MIRKLKIHQTYRKKYLRASSTTCNDRRRVMIDDVQQSRYEFFFPCLIFFNGQGTTVDDILFEADKLGIFDARVFEVYIWR